MSNEQRYYDTLQKIARGYQTSDQIRRSAPKEGFDFDEMLEMVYDNIQGEAERAIHGKRRPAQ